MPHQVVGGGGCSQQCPRIMSHQKGTDETPFKGGGSRSRLQMEHSLTIMAGCGRAGL